MSLWRLDLTPLLSIPTKLPGPVFRFLNRLEAIRLVLSNVVLQYRAHCCANALYLPSNFQKGTCLSMTAISHPVAKQCNARGPSLTILALSSWRPSHLQLLYVVPICTTLCWFCVSDNGYLTCLKDSVSENAVYISQLGEPLSSRLSRASLGLSTYMQEEQKRSYIVNPWMLLGGLNSKRAVCSQQGSRYNMMHVGGVLTEYA